MNLVAALDPTTPVATYVIGGVIAVVVLLGGLKLGVAKKSRVLKQTAGILAALTVIGTLFTGLAVQDRDRSDIIATYLRVHEHLTVTDKVAYVENGRAIARVVTGDGDVRWADITWVGPNDLHPRGGELPAGYEPVTVGLTDTKPAR